MPPRPSPDLASVHPADSNASPSGRDDCASDHAPYPSDKTRGFIYVYDLNPALGLSDERYFEVHGADAIYASEMAFFERLMGDWSVRTLDPTKASLFYVPTCRRTDSDLSVG